MKKHIQTLFLIFVTSLFLSGCSSFFHHFGYNGSNELFSEEECMQIDFHQMGYNDGQMGRAKRDLVDYEDEHGCKVPVNYGAYNAGWQKGIKRYCAPTFMMGMVNGRTGHKLDKIADRTQICHQYGLHFDASQYQKGQERGIKQYCSVERGWQIGVHGKPYPDTCPSYLENAFRSGWESGIRQYCSNNNLAKSLGKKGQPYPSVCSPNIYPHFKYAHAQGIAEYLKKAK